MADEAALIEVVNRIAEEEEHGGWDQSDWAKQTKCGTAHCFAGWKAILDEQELRWHTDPTGYTYAMDLASGEPIEAYAARTLDLTVSQASKLFFGVDTDYDELVVAVKDIISGKIT